MPMFQRYVSVDWSGRGNEHTPAPLAVAMVDQSEMAEIILPPRSPRVRNWTRSELREWLATILVPGQSRTLVALDFGLGLPWGADQGVFDCDGWAPMIEAISELYRQHGTARAAAEAINQDLRFAGHGPYRFNESRTDFRFYLQHEIAYYRLVETAVPQAISQWYLGSGGTVGFHTITGLAALHHLITLRGAGQLKFQVWPQECENAVLLGDQHVIVESYPAIYPMPPAFGPCETPDQCDAWKVLLWMKDSDERGSLAEAFTLPTLKFGRVAGTSFGNQVRFEGWILGVKSGEHTGVVSDRS